MAENGKQLRVVLLGKTGAGKSSLGNKLLNDPKAFDVQRGMSSGTKKCKWAKRQRGDVTVEVIDTPGLGDTREVEKDKVPIEVGKSVAFAAPGPHIILLVLRCDRRFTEEEYKVYQELKQMFGQNICEHMIIVFNGMGGPEDEQDLESQKTILDEDLKNQSKILRAVMDDAGKRYYGVSVFLPQDQKKKQMDELFAMMLDLLQKNNGRHYDGELCKRVEAVKEGWIHRHMETNTCSEEEAREAFKKAMDEEQPGIIESINNALAAFFAPLLTLCSVM